MGEVVVCGHSLGAGVALLLSKLLLGSGHKAKCYAFAPPPCFGPLDKVDEAWSNAVECFAFHFDIVPTLSLGSICEYLKDPSDLTNLSPKLSRPLYIRARMASIGFYLETILRTRHGATCRLVLVRVERSCRYSHGIVVILL